jgi:Protein of unknown function (DUF2971)
MEYLIEPPEILYKYRNWSDCYHKKLITDFELFFASPLSFNDPFDFQISIRYDKLTQQERKDIYRDELVKRGCSHGLELEKVAENLSINGPLADPNNLEKTMDNLQNRMNKYGVVSLSSKADSILMWSHYANNHSGFCVGFDIPSLRRDIQPQVYDVQYREIYPELIPRLGSEGILNLIEIARTKFKAWEYESEYRLAKVDYANTVFKLSERHFKSILLGCTMPIEKKKELKEILNSRLPNIEIYECERHKSNFELILNRTK